MGEHPPVLRLGHLSLTYHQQTTVLWKIFPAHIFVAALCVLWGVSAMSCAAVHSMGQLIACRVFLGIFEASFGAGAYVEFQIPLFPHTTTQDALLHRYPHKLT